MASNGTKLNKTQILEILQKSANSKKYKKTSKTYNKHTKKVVKKYKQKTKVTKRTKRKNKGVVIYAENNKKNHKEKDTSKSYNGMILPVVKETKEEKLKRYYSSLPKGELSTDKGLLEKSDSLKMKFLKIKFPSKYQRYMREKEKKKIKDVVVIAPKKQEHVQTSNKNFIKLY